MLPEDSPQELPLIDLDVGSFEIPLGSTFTSAASQQNLPPELIYETFSHCDNATLATCAQANREVSNLALECLYGNLHIESAQVSRMLAVSPHLHLVRHLKAKIDGYNWIGIPFLSWTSLFEKVREHYSLISLEITSCPVTLLKPDTVTALRNLASLSTLQSMSLSVTYNLIEEGVSSDIGLILASPAIRCLHFIVADETYCPPGWHEEGAPPLFLGDLRQDKKTPRLYTLQLHPLKLEVAKLESRFDLRAVEKLAITPDIMPISNAHRDYQQLCNSIISQASSTVRDLLLELPGDCPDGYFPNIQPCFPLQTFASLERLSLILEAPLQNYGIDSIAQGQQQQALKALESIPKVAPLQELILFIQMKRGLPKPTTRKGWIKIASAVSNLPMLRRIYLYFGKPAFDNTDFDQVPRTALREANSKQQDILDTFRQELGCERVLLPAADHVNGELVRMKFFEKLY